MNDEKEKLLRFKRKKGDKLDDWFTLKSGDIIQLINPKLTGYNKEEKYTVYYHNSSEFFEIDIYYNDRSTCSYEYFAENIEKNGLIVTVLRENLPPYCYILMNDRGQLAKLTKGKKGYQLLDEISCIDLNTARQLVYDLNSKIEGGVSEVQKTAMYIGAMFGWDKEGADPGFYDSANIEVFLGQLPCNRVERRKKVWTKGF